MLICVGPAQPMLYLKLGLNVIDDDDDDNNNNNNNNNNNKIK
jgi:hypothetical protein